MLRLRSDLLYLRTGPACRGLLMGVVGSCALLSGAILLAEPAAKPADSATSSPAKLEFNRDIRPILADKCFQCHGPDHQARQAGLRLDLPAGATAKLESGQQAIVPGNAAQSELLARITSDDADLHMPPAATGKPLTAAQKQTLRQWIEAGAEWQEHWSLIPPRRVAAPPVKQHAKWITNSIDAFVLARLERDGLSPAPPADKATLLRRVSLDLTGLPPTPEEVKAFLADDSPGAYEGVVNRLLASPHYGERMALPWLDAARYADTNGYNNDEPRVMWPWRDWVIEAFNSNIPFDQFIVQQLAGDLLPEATLEQKLATGFNRNHVLTTEGGIVEEEYRVEYVADRVQTTSTVLLGLSFGCARCHDHKFDPITQAEYYQFFAFFNQLPDGAAKYARLNAAPPALKVPSPEQTKKLAQLTAERDKLQAAAGADAATPNATPEAAKANSEKVAAITKQIEELQAAVPEVMIMQDLPEPRQTFVLDRGEYDKHGPVVQPGTPAALLAFPAAAPRNRLGLANWLVAPEHPLTARVAVNRWWSMYFGRGLVETVEDFGSQGAWPTHPELLDWLATELVRTGWDVKAMQKLIVMSATYRQTSDVSPQQYEHDPDNRLLARGARFRLSAEFLRDQALAISGLLVREVGGPSVMPYQPAGLWEDVSVERKYSYVPATGPGLYRRGMYTFWKRTCPPPSMTTFDAPDRESCVARRARTNTPLQSLVLLNDPTFVEAARKLAERMLLEGGADTEARLRYGWLCVLGRMPTEQESAVALRIQGQALARFQADAAAAEKLLTVGQAVRSDKLNPAELAAWTVVANLLLNLDETLTKK